MKWILFWILIISFDSGLGYFGEIVKFVSHQLNIEACNENFISPNFTELYKDLNEKVFGQKIIIDRIIPALKSHFDSPPKKALVMCLHGWTGSGKNYVTQIILDNLYRKKAESKFVHFFSGRLHFPIDKKDYVNEYKINVQNWVKGNVSECPRSLFIFDEVDKIPVGVLDGIKPFLDYNEKIDSVDFRKAIFVFISNIGGGVINSKYGELWRQGILRDDMLYKDFEKHLRHSLYHGEGGFKKSSIIDSNLVSLFLPFLPLEAEQVRMCITYEFTRQSCSTFSEKQVEAVLKEMDFNDHGLSVTGCKRVSDIVASLKYYYNDEL